MSTKAARRRLARILRKAPAVVGEFVVLDAAQDTGLIKQARVTGTWQVQALRVEGRALSMMLRRVEGGALAPDDLTSARPHNTLWLDAARVVACLTRVGASSLAAGCPHCGAPMGEDCRRPSGRRHGLTHVARQEALARRLVPVVSVAAAGVAGRPVVCERDVQALRDCIAARGFATAVRLDPNPPEDDA